MKITTTPTGDDQSPATSALEIAWAEYLGNSYRILRQALHSDERIMRDCMDRVKARDAAKASGGSFIECMRMIDAKGPDGKPLPLTEDQLTRAQAMSTSRIRVRDRLVDCLGLTGTWDRMASDCQGPRMGRRAAAVLHAMGHLPEPPSHPTPPGRRAKTDAEHTETAARFDRMMAEVVG